MSQVEYYRRFAWWCESTMVDTRDLEKSLDGYHAFMVEKGYYKEA